jgi:hypothetical protein
VLYCFVFYQTRPYSFSNNASKDTLTGRSYIGIGVGPPKLHGFFLRKKLKIKITFKFFLFLLVLPSQIIIISFQFYLQNSKC